MSVPADRIVGRLVLYRLGAYLNDVGYLPGHALQELCQQRRPRAPEFRVKAAEGPQPLHDQLGESLGQHGAVLYQSVQ